MQLCLFTHEFHFIEIGKKIRACGHDFEEAMHAYDNLRNPRKDVTDLIGQMEALMLVKYSPRWYNIFWQNTPGPYPRDLHVICCLKHCKESYVRLTNREILASFICPLQFIVLCTMVKYCAVALCRNGSKKRPDLSYFCFPTRPNERK